MMYESNSFCANNNNNNDKLFSSSYTLDQTLLYKPSTNEINSNSEQETPHPQSLYYNVSSSYNHYENDNVFIHHMYDLYLQQQSQITEVNAPDHITTQTTECSHKSWELLEEFKSKENESVVIDGIARKRTSKKDRHSKIETAQGPRDRRMRLSLPVAREFFNLQDALGYNKASKTVEWLLRKSKAAIKDLTSSSANSPSSTSDDEVVDKEKGKNLFSSSKETKSTRGSTRKSMLNLLTKESREKARERARERTREKRKKDGSKNGLEIGISHQMNHLGSWCKDDNNGYQLEFDDMAGELSSSVIFNYDMQNNGVPQENQFRDFSLYEKP